MRQRLSSGLAAGAVCILACVAPAYAQQTPGPRGSPAPAATPTATSTVQPSATVSAPVSPTGTLGPAPPPSAQPSASPVVTPSPVVSAVAPASVAPSGALLSESDLPSGLQFEPRLSGPLSFLNVQGQMTSFVSEAMEGDLAAVPALPDGAVLIVTNLLMGVDPTRPQGLDAFARGGRMGGTLAAGADPSLLDIVDFPNPPVGEDSRAFAIIAPSPGGRDVATAAVIFQRGSMISYVGVAAIGDEAPMAEAVRLAQVVDGRLAAADGGQR